MATRQPAAGGSSHGRGMILDRPLAMLGGHDATGVDIR